MKKAMYIVAGSVSLSLGVVGVFLPVLPTTPFLLLAAFCYLRSSERLYDWLMNHWLFGPFLYNYVTYRAIRMRVKVASITVLWATIIASVLLVHNIYVTLLLVLVGVAVSVHILMLKTLRHERHADAAGDSEVQDGH